MSNAVSAANIHGLPISLINESREFVSDFEKCSGQRRVRYDITCEVSESAIVV